MTRHLSLSIMALATGLILGAPGNRLVAADPQTAETQPSQNAAALLYDPGTIDIRRVGTQSKANVRRGVFRVEYL